MSSDDRWRRLARELAAIEGVPARLLLIHVRTEDGHCAACTTPGRGTPMTVWPCALWTLARTAQQFEKPRHPRRSDRS